MIRIVQAVVIGLLAAFVGSFVWSGLANAEASFDWLNSEVGPTVVEAKVTELEGCNYEIVPTKARPDSEIIKQGLCIKRGKTISSGSNANGESYLKTPADQAYKQISSYSGIKYTIIEGTDTLIVLFNEPQLIVNSLSIFTDYRDLIAEQPSSNSYFYLNPDAKSEYTNNPEKTKFYMISYAVSNNGRYLVYSRGGNYSYRGEVRLLDLETGDIKVIGEEGYSYTYNPLPPPSYAVSNDGKTIAEGGYNLKIWRVDESCRDSNAWSPVYGNDSCLNTRYDWESFGVSQPDPASYPNVRGVRFNDRADHLSFVYHSDQKYSIELAAPGYMPYDQLEYLALGDSYSSGEGDIGKKSDGSSYYLSGTEGDGQCHLSERSYPYLLRDMWDYSSGEMESIACSGARLLPDLASSMDSYIGQHKELKYVDDAEAYRSQAKTNFQRGIIPQIEFIKEYKPSIVTFTGGGNDVGFGDILEYCASPVFESTKSRCAFASDPQIRANLNKLIDSQYDYVRNFIEDIQRVSPMTKTYVIGYPQFITTKGITCTNDSYMLDAYERQMISQSVTRLNNVLNRAARDTGVYFIDIEESLAGGRICEGSKYMTGPLKLEIEKLWEHNVQESYHPNAQGHKKIAEMVNTQINHYTDYAIMDIPEETNGVRVVRMEVAEELAKQGGSYTIQVPEGAIQPDGTVTIEMFSQRTTLAILRANTDGSLTGKVVIPNDADQGMHLLTITGNDFNGEPVQLQQFFYVSSKNGNSRQSYGTIQPDEAGGGDDSRVADTSTATAQHKDAQNQLDLSNHFTVKEPSPRAGLEEIVLGKPILNASDEPSERSSGFDAMLGIISIGIIIYVIKKKQAILKE